MPNPKMKSENYQQFGGINNHASPYVLTPLEFLDIINFDFQTIGSLTGRWGSTLYAAQMASTPIASLTEFSRLDGSSYVLFSYTGAIYYGATTGNSQGVSFSNFTGYSLVDFNWNFLFVSDLTVGIGIGIDAPVYFGATNQAFGVPIQVNLTGQSMSDNTLDSAVLNNYLFASDGNKFFKFNGSTATAIGLPPVFAQTFPAHSASVSNDIGSTIVGIGQSGAILFYASYVNERGFEGQIWPIFNSYAGLASAATLGGSYVISSLVVPLYPEYGIASINIYSYWSGSVTLTLHDPATWNYPYVFLTNIPANAASLPVSASIGHTSNTFGGITFLKFAIGTTKGGMTFMFANNAAFPDPNSNLYFPLGVTVPIGTSGYAGSIAGMYDILAYVPRYIETYQNRLFLAGFSGTPSTVWFSDLAEPEGYEPDFNFEVRTNDADVVSCMRSYATRLYIFKQHSFHVLSGDNPNNFLVQEVSGQYGCINNRCAVIFNDILVFLDQKGVMMYNGSALTVLSIKIQAYFDRMNYNVAINTAIMEHDKLRNQVVVAIPIDGSTSNNITLVYDYLLQAWTSYEGYTPTVFTTIQGRNTTKNLFYGDIQGRVNWFGSSFLADNGVGITCYFKSRFLHDLGNSYEKQFRRLYINATPPGATLNMPLNFYQDYGASIIYSTTFSLGAFQRRIDFGIPATSLSFELYAVPTVTPLQIHGFTIESRLQRQVTSSDG